MCSSKFGAPECAMDPAYFVCSQYRTRFMLSAVKNWVDGVLRGGITSTNLWTLENEFARHQMTVDWLGSAVSEELATNFKLIENELLVANRVIDWIAQAEGLVKSYLIPTSGDQVDEQLKQHRLFFSRLPHLENSSGLLNEIEQRFKDAIALAAQWESAMVEASKRWRRYHLSKERLKIWLLTAEQKLHNTHGFHPDSCRQVRCIISREMS